MSKIPFRDYHLLKLLDAYSEKTLPLDLVVNHYFRAHKSLGSKDRAEIAQTLFTLFRWMGLIDHYCEKPVSWKKRLSSLKNLNSYIQDTSLPPHIRVSFPYSLYERLVNHYGETDSQKICLNCNEGAPLTIRVNTHKISREALLTLLKENFSVFPCDHSSVGITFEQRTHLFKLQEFKDGYFEIQDEASQIIGKLVDARPGQHILDYCSGSGGKTLVFAPDMNNSGQIYLHDIRPHILQEAKKRLKRAGIQNAQIMLPEDPKRKKLKKKMDWVLVDAPCSGTGTLRRNPDMKWKYSDEMLHRLIGEQRAIFEQALSYMSPDGRIVYATCSLLAEENQQQIEHFCTTYHLEVEGEPFQSLPTPGGMDGFFGVVLKFKKNA